MEFIPHNNTILCKLVNEQFEQINNDSFIYKKENLPIYEILKIGNLKNFNNLCIGDKIITNSNPTKINEDSNVYYLIREEYIAGRIID